MIKLLDKATIDKIAAGEVIERPSSVVKELLENSIDAKATAITVEIKDGGLSMIRVTDNGCGIPSDEVKTAYMRHATSKISSAEDLSGLVSLGFRGEALSTIAAVSQTEMISKTPEALIGVRYEIHGGTEISFAEIGVPNGTTIVVRNLFYNTPARKKFLKSAVTEGSYVFDLMLKISLSHPEISFRLIVNGQSKLDTSGNGNIRDVIYQLFGRDVTQNLIPVVYESDKILISGFIGKPQVSFSNRNFEHYFVNKRYIRSNLVNRAIEEGYRTFIMQHKFPFTVLYITLPVSDTDVNVHPTKMEFKYQDERLLFEVISRGVRQCLLEKDLIIRDTEQTDDDKKDNAEIITGNKGTKEADNNERSGQETNVPKNKTLKPAEPYETVRMQKTAAYTNNSYPEEYVKEKYSPGYRILEQLLQKEQENKSLVQKQPPKPTGNPAVDAYIKNERVTMAMKEEQKQKELGGEQASLFDDDFLSEQARKKHRVIGQVFGTYWLIEYERNLYIMDQHAAHEKIKYEELLHNLGEKEIFSQQLMPPLIVTMSYAEHQAVLYYFDVFMRLGYDLEEFGGNEFKINAVPSNLFGLNERDTFLDFVETLVQNSGYMSNEMFVRKLATMACKAAVKGNTQLSFKEADALIDQLLKLENPYTCPHGRPTIVSISDTELEKKFKRIV